MFFFPNNLGPIIYSLLHFPMMKVTAIRENGTLSTAVLLCFLDGEGSEGEKRG